MCSASSFLPKLLHFSNWFSAPSSLLPCLARACCVPELGQQQPILCVDVNQDPPIVKWRSELHSGAPVSLPFLKDNQSVCVYYVSLLVCLCICTSVCLEACLLARHVRQPGAQSRPLDAAWLVPIFVLRQLPQFRTVAQYFKLPIVDSLES